MEKIRCLEIKEDIIRLLRGKYLIRTDGLQGNKLGKALSYNAQFRTIIKDFAIDADAGKNKSIEWFENQLEKIVEKDEEFHYWIDGVLANKKSIEWFEKEIDKIIEQKYEWRSKTDIRRHRDEHTTKNKSYEGTKSCTNMLLFVLVIFGIARWCSSSSYKDVERNDIVSTTISADLIASKNRSFITLFNGLFSYMYSSLERSQIEKEEWMKNYHEKLCEYYDTKHLGSDTLSDFNKTDSVLNIAERLFVGGSLESKINVEDFIFALTEHDKYEAMAKLTRINNLQTCIDECRIYNLLSNILSRCENEEQKALIRHEMEIYYDLSNKMRQISLNLIDLYYWGGSIAGSERDAAISDISRSRVNMYATINNIISGTPWYDKGVPLDLAEQQLLECCNRTFRDCTNLDDGINIERKKEVIDETTRVIKELRPLLKGWIKHWEITDEALTRDATRNQMERAAAYVLIEWASLVSRFK